jgi:queuine tRNA-ribosyltransferase
VDRTYAWAERGRTAHAASGLGSRQALFGIVQGGADRDARERAAANLVALDFPGYGIGGLSVGESDAEMRAALDAAVHVLPADKPRYLMGVGDLSALVDGVAAGVDMFDCVLPTRLGRHARVLTSTGHYSLKRAEHAGDPGPLVDGCDCASCSTGYSRGTLRHLLALGEPTGARLVSIHNLRTVTRLMEEIREAITEGRFVDFRAAFHEARLRARAALPVEHLG